MSVRFKWHGMMGVRIASHFCVMAAAILGVLPASEAADPQDPPANDSFVRREILSGDYAQASADNTLASAEPGEPDHGGISAGRSLWWSWTAPADGWLTIDASPSFFAPCFAVYRGDALSTLEGVAANRIWCPRLARNAFQELSPSEIFHVTAGETYQIAFASSTFPTRDADTAPRGNVAFSLLLGQIEITSPASGAEFPSDAEIPVHVAASASAGAGRSVWLELDGTILREWPTELNAAAGPGLLSSLPLGAHSLRALMLDPNGPERYSPTVVVHIRPPNDDFDHATVLQGEKLRVSADSFYATTQPEEPKHPGEREGFTLWYRWTAPADGVVRMTLATTDVGAAIYRGTALNTLIVVSVNPLQHASDTDHLSPLHPTLYCAVEAGVTYAIQFSNRSWGPLLGAPSFPCDPDWVVGYPFSFEMEFQRTQITQLEMIPYRDFFPLPWKRDSALCYFAARRGATFALETSTNLQTWVPAVQRPATGGTEFFALPANLQLPSQFFRVRLTD